MESMNMRMVKAVMIIVVLGVLSELGSCKVVQFIFGDSLSDVGNNRKLQKSLATANLPWYGIDFGNGMPNGRFCNGRTVADIIGDHIGLPRPPAFLDPALNEEMILENGVNFASGGGGILNETGSYFIQKFCLYKQIELFKGTQELIRRKIGAAKAATFFEESNYVVALGSNDFINNYLQPVMGDSWKYTDSTFIDYLMETLESQLKLLHSLGARKLVVFGLGPMGCIPLQRVLSTSGGCQVRTNNLALSFNKASGKLVSDLSKSLPNATYQFGDAYDVVADVIANPNKYGFNNSDSPCCSFGSIRPALTCVPLSTLCADRSSYVFWDEYHPSDRANEMIAKEIIRKLGYLYTNSTSVGSPSPSPVEAPAKPTPEAPATAPRKAPAPKATNTVPAKAPTKATPEAPAEAPSSDD
ncbi:GDSL esterase/lipase At1g74460-like [Papaver somniferum]|uniref:GDSL esterase/lipase At1g74460-like n=1 Tax=Papaver somniferum TaxID=3469 RepID=UPI000E703560|nr:GDSL esterase/lipase At1g74460-like [Papaver somniferum]